MPSVKVPLVYPRLDEIQGRIAAALGEVLTESAGWRLSVYAPRQLGLDGGPGTGGVYSVELPNTELPEIRRMRRGDTYATEPMQAHTTVVVRWIWTLPADGQDAAYTQALRVEATIMGALVAGNLDITDLHPLRVTRARRDIIGDGTHVHGQIECMVDHAYVIEKLADVEP